MARGPPDLPFKTWLSLRLTGVAGCLCVVRRKFQTGLSEIKYIGSTVQFALPETKPFPLAHCLPRPELDETLILF